MKASLARIVLGLFGAVAGPALIGPALIGGPAHADTPLGVEVDLGGGSVIAWDASNETGNAFGGTALVDYGDFGVGLGAAAVMPDSRLQGEFGAFWVEGRWFFLGRDGMFAPYAVAGIGLAGADGFQQGGTGFVPARWSSSMGFLGMAGAGLRFGGAEGLFLAADVRAWNYSHLGLSLMAGFRFF